MKKADEEEEEYDKELLRSLKAEYGEEGGRRYVKPTCNSASIKRLENHYASQKAKES